jgi:hypothetical protein
LAEFLAAVAGAVIGATIARALGAEDMIVVAAIAGSFIGGGLVPGVRAARDRRTTPPHDQ